MEFVKGHLSFPGTASPNGKWTAEDDRLAQLMEVFGPFPEALLARSTRAQEYFDDKGTQIGILFNILHVALTSHFLDIIYSMRYV